MISKCPQCGDQVSIPEGVIAEATVRCPVCAAEYPLADALASAPPMLIVVDLGPNLALAPSAAALGAATAVASWPTDAQPTEAPVAADDLDRWLTPEPSASERQAEFDLEPVDGTIGAENGAQAAEDGADITIETEGEEHAATEDDMFALVGHGDESDTTEIGDELFAESEAAKEGAVAAEDSGEIRLQGEAAAGAPSETLEADEAFAGFAAVQESKEVGASTAAKMRRKRGKSGNPIMQIVGLVGGGVVGLFLGYYVLNFFWGEQHDYLKVWLPGVAHTTKHRPTWLGGGTETVKADPNAQKTVTPDKAATEEPPTPVEPSTNPDTTPTDPTDKPKSETPGDATGTETPKPEPADPSSMTPPGPETPTTPGAADPFGGIDVPKIDIPPPAVPKDDTPKPETPKPETPSDPFGMDAPKPETPKVDEPKPDEPKPETPKPETPSDPFGMDAPKPETPKVDEPKPDEPKPEPPKSETTPSDPFGMDAPKPETPKVDEPKPEPPIPETPKPDMPKVDEPKIDVPMPETPKIDEPKVDTPKPEASMPEKPKVDEPKPETPAATVGPKNPPVYSADDLAAAVKDAGAAFQPKAEVTPEVYAKFARLAEVAAYAKDDAAKLTAQQAEVVALLEKVARAGAAPEFGKLAAQQLKSTDGPKGGVLLACVMGKEFSKDGLFGATIETLGDPHRTPVFNNKTLGIEPGKQVFVLGCVLADPANNLAGAALTKPWIIWSGPVVVMPQ